MNRILKTPAVTIVPVFGLAPTGLGHLPPA